MVDVQDIEILLVEDNDADVEMTLRALAKNNLANRVHVVSDGAEALDFLFGRGTYAYRDVSDWPRVVLLDIKLPKVDGIEVLRQVRADPRTAEMPIVMLTSSADERDVVEAYRLKANSYIVKPVDFHRFIDAVADLGLYWMLLNKPPRQ
ncbi:MAG: response regulator [Coriobacteriia bacterium]